MINGAHVIIYSADAEADRKFITEVIGLPHVDVGDGWLIFGLPASELAIHPAEQGGTHELYFMCDDIGAFIDKMSAAGVAASEAKDMGWGVLSTVALPGGGELGVYEPRHARPPAP